MTDGCRVSGVGDRGQCHQLRTAGTPASCRLFFLFLLPLLSLLSGCMTPTLPPTELDRLSSRLEDALLRGNLQVRRATPEQERALRDPQIGFVRDYRAWSQHCIAYNRKLEAAQQYTPLPPVRRLKENPIQAPAIGDRLARTYTNAAAIRTARSLLGMHPDGSCTHKLQQTEPLARFIETFGTAAELVDRKALGAVPGKKRELLHFVLPWICTINRPFVNQSKGAPAYRMNWAFYPNDPFRPGTEKTRSGRPVPKGLYSMTGLYHYLRALAAQPVQTTGIRPDYAKDKTVPHPQFSERIDFPHFVSALQLLEDVLDERGLTALQQAIADRLAAKIAFPGVVGKLIHTQRTQYGDIVIGGDGPNRYDNVDAAVIIDLGGNDEYIDDGKPENLTKYPVRIIIDFAGDDVYVAKGVGGPGAGILGISILIDRQGNDRYCQGLSKYFQPRQHSRKDLLQPDPEGDKTNLVPFVSLYGNPDKPKGPGVILNAGFAFGAGFLGVGILIDEAGDDLYLGQKFCFGSGMWTGIGVHQDLAGNDVYAAGNSALGAGINNAFGILDDRGGNDHYQCLGLHESGYSVGRKWDSGYDGAGIGYGSSWRAEARSDKPADRWFATFGGGLGLLHDGDGNDQYIAGSFAIGAGYAGGVGMVVDDKGDDTYFVKRGPKGDNHNGWSGNHALGNGCHRGFGYVLDRAGNDRYSASSLGGGCAWDIGLGYLLDLGGNDEYTDLHGRNVRGGSGNGMAKSFAVLLNLGGADVYRRSSLGSAHALAPGYPGVGGNFSFFFDIGPEEDTYPKPNKRRKYANNTSLLSGVVFQKDKKNPDAPADPQGIGLFVDGLLEGAGLALRSGQ